MTISYAPELLKKRLGGRNIYLVGMMGSGKSQTGPHLAKALNYGFVDADNVIEQLCGKAVSKIFEMDGEKGFRLVESQVLNAIGQRHSLVVATGGGVVIKSQNWGVLHQGIVIWIDPGKERLFLRLQADPGDRPLLQKNLLFSDFEDLVASREKFYDEADLHLQIGDSAPKEVAKQIVQSLPSILNDPEAPNAQQTTVS